MVTNPLLTILGSGTSAGIPVIGCDCPTCTSTDPRDRRLRTSACLRFTDPGGTARVVLLDTSPDLRQQALGLGLRRADAILYTHNHVDHTFGLDEVRRFNVLMDAPIDIYADAHTMDSLHVTFRHIFRSDRNVNESFVASLISHVIEPAAPFPLFGLHVTPIPLLHGRLPMLGFRIDGPAGCVSDGFPLAYCTDVSAIPPESWPLLDGLRTLVLDLLRHRKHPTHFSYGEAVATAERIGAERTWFVHMNHEIRHAEVDAELPHGMALAYDGLEIG